MATVTLSTIRERLGRAVGFYFNSTTTGGGSSTTLVDTSIVKHDSGILPNKWVLITSGSADGQVRRIASISGSTVTVTSAFSATIATSVTYELFVFDPGIMVDAIGQALRTVFPSLYLPIVDETLIVDQLLANGDFETFASSTFTGWTHTAGTWTQETNRVVHGSNSATSSASGAASQITQNLLNSTDIDQVTNKTLTIRGWVRATVASAARLRVTFDGSTFTNGSYHSGNDEWEGPSLQYIDVTVPADATQMTVYCEVADGNTANFDLVAAWIDNINLYTMPTSLPDGPNLLTQQADANKPNGLYLPLSGNNEFIPGRLLRLTGMGYLSVPTTEAGTTELSDQRAELVIAEAAWHMYRTLRGADAGQEANAAKHEADWRIDAETLRRQPGIRMSRMGAHKRIKWDSSDASGSTSLRMFR
jgi:hypothetical protein